MKRFSEQLHKKAMTVKLRAAEKRELRARVVSYMEYHPLPAEMKNSKTAKEPTLLTEKYRKVTVPFNLIARLAVGAFALIIVVIPFIAEQSVPGDNLYAVKRFNEDMRGTLAFDAIQKVEWETELLNRRIGEARLLASEGRLTDEVEAKVAEAVRTHSENVQRNIEVLRGEDADAATLASIALETNLSVQSAALQDDSNQAESSSEDGEGLARSSILATVVEETRAKTNATNASATIPSFDKVMAKVEQNTTRVYELHKSLTKTVSQGQISEIARRIEDIERSIGEAVTLREADDDGARTVLIDALQRTQRLIVFMTALDVSKTFNIESIVPLILTDEEERVALISYQAELDNKIARINEALSTTTDDGMAEKATIVLSEIELLLTSLGTSTDYKQAEITLLSAIELANNIFTVLEFESEILTPDLATVPSSTTTTTEAASTDEVIETIATSSTTTSTDVSNPDVDNE